MKLHLLMIPLLFYFAGTLHAQFAIGDPGIFEQIKKQKLVVLLIRDATNYNEHVKEFVVNNWKYGEYDFVYPDDLGAYKKAKDVFFLGLKALRVDQSNSKSINGALTLSTRTQLPFSPGMKDIHVYVPFSNGLVEFYNPQTIAPLDPFMRSHSLAEFKGVLNNMPKALLDVYLKILLDQIDDFKADKIKTINIKRLIKHYESKIKMPDLNDKTLLIQQYNIPIQNHSLDKKNEKFLDEAEVAKCYQRAFKLVTKEELAKAIETKDSSAFFLHSVTFGRGMYYFLYDIASDQLIYLNIANIKVGSNTLIDVFGDVLTDINTVVK